MIEKNMTKGKFTPMISVSPFISAFEIVLEDSKRTISIKSFIEL